METKICRKCETEKNICEFYKSSSSKDGLYYQCKTCKNLIRKEYYNNNIDREHLKNKNYRSLHPEHNKIWRTKNKEKINQHFKNKLKSDPIKKITHNLRCRLNRYLKLNEIVKNKKSIQYFGCTPTELRTHIESQFIDGMSWDNYGPCGWHIDHISPLSLVKTEEDVYNLCHYTNLQPLWAKDNLSKGNKIL